MAMVLRSLYLDPELDAELAARAEDEGTTKAELMRRFLVEGLGRPATMFAGYATTSGAQDRRSSLATAAPMARAARGARSPLSVVGEGPSARPTSDAPSRPALADKKKARVNAPSSRRAASR